MRMFFILEIASNARHSCRRVGSTPNAHRTHRFTPFKQFQHSSNIRFLYEKKVGESLVAGDFLFQGNDGLY